MSEIDTRNATTARGGRPVEWTTDKIDAAVAELLDGLGRTRYPRQRDFADAGLAGLCRTIRSRAGGTAACAARVGCLPPVHGRLAARPVSRSAASRNGARS